MTRKDYQKIAHAFYAVRQDRTHRGLGQVLKLQRAITDVLKEDNPRFDEALFGEACMKGYGI